VARRYLRGTPAERFEARVEQRGECWEYQGHRHRGYGKFGVSPRESVLAHRFAYELWVGQIPEGAVVHHRCENPACVRPEHLELKSNERHSHEHTYAKGFVENQYGVWPIIGPEARREKERLRMRAKRALLRERNTMKLIDEHSKARERLTQRWERKSHAPDHHHLRPAPRPDTGSDHRELGEGVLGK
jgi:hypothetical protein